MEHLIQDNVRRVHLLHHPDTWVDKGDEQPSPYPDLSSDEGSDVIPPRSPDKYYEDDAARVVMELKMFMERLLPDRKENYILRRAGYGLMANITIEIERGQMDDELWDVRYIEVQRVLEQMYESEDFPRGFVLV